MSKREATPVDEMRQDLLEVVRSLKSYVCNDMEKGYSNRFYMKDMTARNNQDRKPQTKEKAESLEDIRKELQGCNRCPLSEGRKTVVFGEGNPKARLLFIGEGPGEEEDKQGRPFVGRAGQLLDKIIIAMGMKREDVYIANVVKCRPPKNRAPKPEEVDACTPLLDRQIRAIRPEVICALGASSAQYLMRTDVPVSVLRGRFHDYNGIPVMVTYHPAYLLRNPAAKKQVWEDMQKIMTML